MTKGKRPTEIASLDAQLERAQANLKLSAAQFARREQLGGADVVSKEELDQARARNATRTRRRSTSSRRIWRPPNSADATTPSAPRRPAVESQRAALDKAKWSFDQKQQFAPTNAFVQDTLYRQGEWVAAGNPVVVLLPPENLKVRFFVPQEMLPRIKTGGKRQRHF